MPHVARNSCIGECRSQRDYRFKINKHTSNYVMTVLHLITTFWLTMNHVHNGGHITDDGVARFLSPGDITAIITSEHNAFLMCLL